MKMHGYIYKTIGFFSRAQGHNALKPVAIAIAAATGSAADTGLRQQATGNEQQVAVASMVVGGVVTWSQCHH